MKARIDICSFLKEWYISVHTDDNPPTAYAVLNSLNLDWGKMMIATTENLRNVIAVLRLAGVEVELTSHAQALLDGKEWAK